MGSCPDPKVTGAIPRLGVAAVCVAFQENPTWNKNTTGSLKYIKHRDILRSQLRVCNVQVWKDGDGSLRAHIKSLRALAVADASCALASIPNSYLHAAEHHHDEGGARGGKAPAAGVREGPH